MAADGQKRTSGQKIGLGGDPAGGPDRPGLGSAGGDVTDLVWLVIPK